MLLWSSDVHIPIHHPAACKLMVEAAESVGVTHNVAGGDILDLHCLSKHDKDADRVLEQGTLLEEAEPGRWLLDWYATRPCYYVLGNHEGRLDRFINENLALYGSQAGVLGELVGLDTSIEVLPVGSELRLGNLAMFHGDAEFKKSTGGKYPAQKLLDMCPDQSSICGHLHRMNEARRTTKDEQGIRRTRKANTMGHMSIEEKHFGYVSKHPNWQMGFAFIRVWWEGDRPRWTVYPIEVLFDRRNRPYFEFNGVVHR